MENNNYLELHELFIDKNEIRDWLTKPFNAGNYTLSSDAKSILITPKVIDADDYSDKIKGIFPVEYNSAVMIPLSTIKKAYQSAPLVDGYKTEERIKEECEACNGEGEVEYEFSHRGEEYTTMIDCPICDGQGEIYEVVKNPTGKKEVDEDVRFEILGAKFKPNLINRLIIVAEKVKADYVTVVYFVDTIHQCIFEVGEVEVLLMPCTPHSDDVVLQITENCTV